MQISYLDGPHKGDVVEMPYHVAAPLLASGYVILASNLPPEGSQVPPEVEMPEPIIVDRPTPKPSPAVLPQTKKFKR